MHFWLEVGISWYGVNNKGGEGKGKFTITFSKRTTAD